MMIPSQLNLKLASLGLPLKLPLLVYGVIHYTHTLTAVGLSLTRKPSRRVLEISYSESILCHKTYKGLTRKFVRKKRRLL